MDKCKYCGSKDGFYIKGFAKGHIQTNFNFDGSEAENGEMYEGLFHTQSKYAYCLSCDKRLLKTEDMQINY